MRYFSYIFPGVGLGALAAGAKSITDDDFTAAAQTLASLVEPEQLAKGCAYPPVKEIRRVSLEIAAAVAQSIVRSGRGDNQLKAVSLAELKQLCSDLMYVAEYKE